jgi:CDP-diacylglycerol--serine O-phosphatidyltransferase
MKVRRPKLVVAKNAANQTLKGLPINKFIPNLITVTSICSGLSSIRFALAGQWEYAVWAIIIAAMLDGIDGRVARLLNSTSKFGAELDSLADFCNFGVCPAVVIYLYQLNQFGRVGWFIVLFYAICMVLRLARFNTMLPDSPSAKPSEFFTGVPAPVGGLLSLLPMIIQFELESFKLLTPEMYAPYLLVVALMLISRIPTFSFKKVYISPKYALLTMMIGAMIAVGFILAPWIVMILVALTYLCLIPFSIRAARVQRKS